MDPSSLALLQAFHKGAANGSLHDADIQRLHAFIRSIAGQALPVQQIVDETVAFLSAQSLRPWRQVVARDLGTRVAQGVALLRSDPLAPH